MLAKRHILVPLTLLSLAMAPATAGADTPTPGDIPDNQAFVRFSTATYSLTTPEGWARVTKRQVVRLTDKYNAISIEVGTAAAAPTVSSVTTRELPRLRSVTPGFRAPRVSSVVRPAGRVVLIRYQARSPRDAVTGRTIVDDVERYEYWKSGRLAVVTLQAPRGSDNVDAWRTITSSFRWR